MQAGLAGFLFDFLDEGGLAFEADNGGRTGFGVADEGREGRDLLEEGL